MTNQAAIDVVLDDGAGNGFAPRLQRPFLLAENVVGAQGANDADKRAGNDHF